MVDLMTWDLTIMGKNKKDASTDSGLGASAQTLVLRRKTNLEAHALDFAKFVVSMASTWGYN